MRLGKAYGDDRLNAACKRALTLGSVSYKSLESILKNNLDQEPLMADSAEDVAVIDHGNIRGASYYRCAPGAAEKANESDHVDQEAS